MLSSSSSSMARAPVYHASLVDKSQHSPELLKLLYHTDITRPMIQWLADKTKALIPCASEATLLPSPPHTPGAKSSSVPLFTRQLPSLERFIRTLVERSRVHTATLLSTSVFLERIAQRIPKGGEGLPDTCHRIFLATLIIASKALNDSSPKNSHWVEYARFFSAADVIMMEKQLLALLDYNLRFSEPDLLLQLSPFLPSPAPTPSTPPKSTTTTTPARPTLTTPTPSRNLYLSPSTTTPPALERSGSTSSLASTLSTPSSCGPLTPSDPYMPILSYLSSPSPMRLHPNNIYSHHRSPSPKSRRQLSLLKAPPAAALRKLSSSSTHSLAYSPYLKPYSTPSSTSSHAPTLARAEAFLDRLICKRTKKFADDSDSMAIDDVFHPQNSSISL